MGIGKGWGFLAHAAGCVLVFGNCYAPFALGFGPVFLTWEISTIFLNPHWFFDKLQMTGSKLQLYNGILLLASFFVSRLVVGTWESYKFQYLLWETWMKDEIILQKWLMYSVSNGALVCLNFIWFRQMIDSVRKRFAPVAAGKKKKGAKKVE